MFPLQSPPPLVLFDCDGVLVDSERISDTIFTRHLQLAGVDIDLAEARREFTGMAMPDIRIKVRNKYGTELDESWHPNYRTECNAAFEKHLQPIRFVREAVDQLIAAQIPYCVASSGPMEKMQTTLGITGLLPLFEHAMFTGWDVPQSKPAPDLFLAAADQFSAVYADCVVVEDSPNGVQAGVAAGMKVLGYAEEDSHHDLSAWSVHLFDDMRDLPRLLGIG